MKASGRYDERIDSQMSEFYGGRFGSPVYGSAAMPKNPSGHHPDEGFNIGNGHSMLTDDVHVDEGVPLTSAARRPEGAGTLLRVGHRLPTLPTPPKAERVFDSKFIFRDISGRAKNNARTLNPLVAAGWDGVTRQATNKETLYRSWETRYWGVDKASAGSTKHWPFADKNADKARDKKGFRVAP